MTITLTTERLKQFALDKRMCNVTDEIISMALELIGSRETIDAQAARIAEQQAVIDQRNGECDRLINELAALREQKKQATPVAVPKEMEESEAAYQDCPHGLSTAFMEGANSMRAEVLRLNGGSNQE